MNSAYTGMLFISLFINFADVEVANSPFFPNLRSTCLCKYQLIKIITNYFLPTFREENYELIYEKITGMEMSSENNFSKSIKNFKFLLKGPFKVYFKGIIHCNENPNSKIQFNLYLNKKTINETDLKGNITLKIPFDDSLSFRMNLAIKDSIGGWKNNAYSYHSRNAYTTLKNLIGQEWQTFLNRFHIKEGKSNILPGVYITDGYPISKVKTKGTFPKEFFYGTYQVVIDYLYTNGNTEGCLGYVVDIKRPWELE